MEEIKPLKRHAERQKFYSGKRAVIASGLGIAVLRQFHGKISLQAIKHELVAGTEEIKAINRRLKVPVKEILYLGYQIFARYLKGGKSVAYNELQGHFKIFRNSEDRSTNYFRFLELGARILMIDDRVEEAIKWNKLIFREKRRDPHSSLVTQAITSLTRLFGKKGDSKNYKLWQERLHEHLKWNQTLLIKDLLSLTERRVKIERLEKDREIKRLRNIELKGALRLLKQSQAQLVAQEKLASLGELRAGVAHELQNPLNFVNNFSQINLELCQEIQVDIVKDSSLSVDQKFEAMKEILAEIEANSTRIVSHGSSAASIVAGMLKHSKKDDGRKTHLKINQLLGDYSEISIKALQKNYSEMRVNTIFNLIKMSAASYASYRISVRCS